MIPGEFLVKFKAGTSKEYIGRTLSKASPSTVRAFKSVPGLRRVTVGKDTTPGALKAALGADEQIEYIEPNFIVSIASIPDDPDFNLQFGLHNTGQFGGTVDADIDAPEAWDVTTGSDNIVVGVIDTGVDYRHQDLARNIFSSAAECTANGVDDDGNGYVDDCHGINAITGSSDPMDDRNHGTHVAGIIGAVGNNGIGVAGVAWHVRILPCKFLNSEGEGSTADAITCMDYLADLKDRGVNIVATNNSWGGYDDSRALQDAIAAHRQRNILFVAAAGNASEDNDLLPGFPCSFLAANVICVGATGYTDYRSYFSNVGRSAVDLSAPGEGIRSTVPNNAYDSFDGTSMATPHVTGAIVLLAAQDPTRDWRALKNLIIAGGDVLDGVPVYTVSRRRLNVARSLACTDSVVRAKILPATSFDWWRSTSELTRFNRPIGTPIPLQALHINCAAGAGPVTVSVAPSGEVVTLLDDGAGFDEAAGDGLYSGAWTPQTAGEFTLAFDGIDDTPPVTIVVDPWLKPGFPRQTLSVDLSYYYLGVDGGSSTVVGNIDGDPSLEILVSGNSNGPLYAWHHDGREVVGWPFYEGGTAFPSLGELDGDPAGLEVAGGVVFRGLMAFDGDGSVLPGWPRTMSAFMPVALVDVDRDGLDEIIAHPARRADGSLLVAERDVPAAGPLAGTSSAADLDGDGEMDFVSVYVDTMWASNRNGMLPGFPAHTEHEMGQSYLTNVAIGDVDGDGHLEIVAPAADYPDWIGRALVFSDKGQIERTLDCTSPQPSMPVLADLDADGIPEIILSTTSQVYAWKGSGALMPGWPVELGDNGASSIEPVVGDVDGDGSPDVVVAVQQAVPWRTARMHAFARNGTPLSGFPLSIETSVGMMPPAIADIDLDGRNDLIVATNPDWGRRDGVFAFDLHGPGPYGAIEWGQHLGGANHRGYYELGKNLTQDAYLTTLAHGEGSISTANGDIQCGADCIQRYRKGTSVTLTARPTAQGRFNRWMGACAGRGNPCTISIQSYTSVAAQFDTPLTVTVTGTGTGSVTSNPAGISCPSVCSKSFDARTVVTLTATPAPGSSFDGWGGACSGRSATCTVNIDAAQSVSAKFVTKYGLTVVATGTGTGRVTSQPAGIDCGARCSADFPVNTSVTLTVVPAADSTFTGWTVPCPSYLSPTCTVTMDQARTMTATFVRKTSLSVSRTGTGHGRIRTLDNEVFCGSTCIGLFDPGSVTVAYAEPDFDSYFVEWSGDCSGTGDCLLVMEADKATAARFDLKPVLRVTASGDGRVSSSDFQITCEDNSCSAIYPLGAPVTLTAAATGNASFTGWSGACSGQSATCDLTMDSAKDVTARFTKLTPAPGGNSGGGRGGGGGSEGMIELLLLLSALHLSARMRRHRY